MRVRSGVAGLIVLAIAGILSGCGGGASSRADAPQHVASNELPVSINLGPDGNYANGLFTNVTICVPGTSNCQTIGDVLVDTGSSGLRLVSTVLTISLPQQKGSNGGAVLECLPFMSGYTWGPVQTADVILSGEKAAGIALQIMSDTSFPVASGCKNTGLPSQNSVQTLGANGILGVGELDQDCPACATSGGTNPGLYYECTAAECTTAVQSLSQQVRNPVASFPTDNNGVLITLPALGNPISSASGLLTFGIGTESNNSLGSAQVYTTDEFGNFTTKFEGQNYSGSFIDSGSNGLFFLDTNVTGIAACSDANGFYCPGATVSLSASNMGMNGTTGTVNFSIANADKLFSGSNAAFSDLGGPNPGLFDWGIPFFFGRTVFTAIVGKDTPAGMGPYWAY